MKKITKKAPTQPFLDKRSFNIDSGWSNLASDVSFGDLTYAQFHAKRLGNTALRLQLKTAEQTVKSLQLQVQSSDLNLWLCCGLVVRGVAGNALYGPDSALYAAFGLIPTSKRKSGLTRKQLLERARLLAQTAPTQNGPAIQLPVVSNGYSNGHALVNGG